MFDAFEQLFAPGRRHLTEERNRLLATRDEAGDAGPGRGPVDLDSGVVVIKARGTAGQEPGRGR